MNHIERLGEKFGGEWLFWIMDELIVDDISIEITRKRIKHLYLRITSPTGEVKISSPRNMSQEYIRSFVISKIDWIRNQQVKVRSRKRAEPAKYVTGEKLYFDGKELELSVIAYAGNPKAIVSGESMILYVRDVLDKDGTKRLVERFYRKHLKKLIPEYITKWEPVMGVKVNFFNVKRMKTKWGTCNTRRGRIWLNLELAKKDRKLLEYVVVHEMVHLLERNHSKRFYGFMDEFMPEWKELRKELNGE